MPGVPGMMVYPKIAHEVMPFRAVFMLEVYAYLAVAVTLKTRSLRFAPLTWSSHAGYMIYHALYQQQKWTPMVFKQ